MKFFIMMNYSGLPRLQRCLFAPHSTR